MSLRSTLGWTLGAALVLPLSPLLLVHALTHQVVSSGNGADAWLTFFEGILGMFGSIALAAAVIGFLINPLIAGAIYGGTCLAVGIKMGETK